MLFVLRRRFQRRVASIIVPIVILAFGAALAAHAAGPPRYTLTVFDFNLNPSAGNTLFIYQGDHQLAQASVFNGTLRPDGMARFRLPPGDYVVYVTRGMLDTRAAPSGALRSASLTVPLHHDTRVDFLHQAHVTFRGS